jgi:CheY-like chemotaxis protein
MKGDREEFIEAGCTDYLAKPFSRSDLLEKIKQVAEK